MAKKRGRPPGSGGQNKAQTIRDYQAAHADQGPTQIAKALNDQKGWKISPTYVSNILSKARPKRGRRAKGAGGRPVAASTGGFSLTTLLEAQKLVKQLGDRKSTRLNSSH